MTTPRYAVHIGIEVDEDWSELFFYLWAPTDGGTDSQLGYMITYSVDHTRAFTISESITHADLLSRLETEDADGNWVVKTPPVVVGFFTGTIRDFCDFMEHWTRTTWPVPRKARARRNRSRLPAIDEDVSNGGMPDWLNDPDQVESRVKALFMTCFERLLTRRNFKVCKHQPVRELIAAYKAHEHRRASVQVSAAAKAAR